MILNAISANDLWFENLMFGIRTPFGLHIATWVTFLGNAATVIAIAGLIGALLIFSKSHRTYFIGLFTTLAGASASAYFLKEIVGRARPSGLIPVISETDFSFPSGHATISIALYGFIAFLLCRLYPRYRWVVVAIASLIILSIGFSRLYLGLHFPSDVIAGYVVGGFWLLMGSKLTNRLQAHS